MLGRFYSVPLVWSAGLIAASPIAATRPVALPFATAIVVLGLLAPFEPALLSGYGYTPFDNWLRGRSERSPRDNGLLITDSKSPRTPVLFEGNGLLKGRLGDSRPDHPGVDDGLELRAGGRQVVTRYSIGFTGYFAGPDVHIVDVLALTDPLLARLPSIPGARVGHYQREIPVGYLESLRANGNLIADPDLAGVLPTPALCRIGPGVRPPALGHGYRLCVGTLRRRSPALHRQDGPGTLIWLPCCGCCTSSCPLRVDSSTACRSAGLTRLARCSSCGSRVTASGSGVRGLQQVRLWRSR